MSKRLSWLDKFAEEQAEKMQKTAKLNKKAEQIIVDPEEVPGAADGTEITYKNAQYKVVDASYSDEIGSGVVLEKCSQEVEASLEELPTEEAPVEEVPAVEEAPVEEAPVETPVVEEAPVAPAAKRLTDSPEIARTNPGDVYSIGDVRDQVEVDKFNQEANETAQQVAQENSADRTTPEGKYTSNRILQQMVGIVPVETPVAEAPVEAPVEEVPAVEEAPVEEAPVEETETEEAPVDEEVKLARVQQNKKVLAMSEKLAKAIELEAEEILEHAEEAIKGFVPAKYVKATLLKLEKALESEGIEALFDKTITREALRKTAKVETSAKELQEVVEAVTKAVVAEFEDVLEDADGVADETVAKFDGKFEVESKLKNTVERKLASKGIYAKLARNHSK